MVKHTIIWKLREELSGADCLCATPDEVRRACEEAIAAAQ